jgi:hypothetical protein
MSDSDSQIIVDQTDQPLSYEEELQLEKEQAEEDEEDAKGVGKTIWYVIISAVLLGFFFWLLIGLWGFLQEMTYGHG